MSTNPSAERAALAELLKACRNAMAESMRFYGSSGTNWTNMIESVDAALASTPTEPISQEEWLDDAYERLCQSCKGAGEVPPTLPTFVRGLIGMVAPTMGAGTSPASTEVPALPPSAREDSR